VLSAERERRLQNDPRSLAAALVGLGTGKLPSLWDTLARIETPTLLIAGELDAKYAEIARRMSRRMPNARAVVVSGAGHTVHLEAPAAWLDAVVGFLAEESRASRGL
jgi:pimeloyl-ACP methyl ester carboxylesterase